MSRRALRNQLSGPQGEGGSGQPSSRPTIAPTGQHFRTFTPISLRTNAWKSRSLRALLRRFFGPGAGRPARACSRGEVRCLLPRSRAEAGERFLIRSAHQGGIWLSASGLIDLDTICLSPSMRRFEESAPRRVYYLPRPVFRPPTLAIMRHLDPAAPEYPFAGSA